MRKGGGDWAPEETVNNNINNRSPVCEWIDLRPIFNGTIIAAAGSFQRFLLLLSFFFSFKYFEGAKQIAQKAEVLA